MYVFFDKYVYVLDGSLLNIYVVNMNIYVVRVYLLIAKYVSTYSSSAVGPAGGICDSHVPKQTQIAIHQYPTSGDRACLVLDIFDVGLQLSGRLLRKNIFSALSIVGARLARRISAHGAEGSETVNITESKYHVEDDIAQMLQIH